MRFLSWFLKPDFQEQLITRLLDQNEALMDKLLLQAGHDPIHEPKPPEIIESKPSLQDEATLAEEAQSEQVQAYAMEAATDPEMMEQAVYNANPDNHPGWRQWREVVKQAESMMERPS
jgi:hypothetical protein